MYNIVENQYVFQTGTHLNQEGQVIGFTNLDSGELYLNQAYQVGYFLLHVIDSGKRQMTWQRFILETITEGEAVNQCYLLTGENEERVNLTWKNQQILPEEKLALLLSLGGKVVTNEADFLLHDLKGRYLWVGIKVTNLENKGYYLKGLTIDYPKQTFVDYLPAIYADEGGLIERYVAIFQNLYLELEEVIDQLPNQLEPSRMSQNFLEYIGSWIGLDNRKQLFNEQQIRKLLLKFCHLEKAKGTKGALIELLEIIMENKPVIIEYFKWRDHVKEEEREDYRRLYGQGPYTFTVILDPELILQGVEKKAQDDYLIKLEEKIKEIVEAFKPVLTKERLVFLKKEVCLDGHTYLGINTFLSCDEAQVCRL